MMRMRLEMRGFMGIEENKNVFRTVSDHVRSTAPWVMVVLVVSAILGAVLLTVHFVTDIDVNLFLADPAEKAFLPEYTGMYTYIGVFALLTAGAICFFSAALLRDQPHAWPSDSFLISFGIIIAWLGIDDVFMVHEWVGLLLAEMAGSDNVPHDRARLETVVFVAYGIVAVLWGAKYWRTILRTAWMLLLLTMISFGLSAGLDVGIFLFPELVPSTPWMPTTLAVAEELLKLAGIFFVGAYALHTASGAVRRAIYRDGSGRAHAQGALGRRYVNCALHYGR